MFRSLLFRFSLPLLQVAAALNKRNEKKEPVAENKKSDQSAAGLFAATESGSSLFGESPVPARKKETAKQQEPKQEKKPALGI